MTGGIQLYGVHIRRPLLQLGILLQCHIQFGRIFSLLLTQLFQRRFHGGNILPDLWYTVIVFTIKLIKQQSLLTFQFLNIFRQTSDFLRQFPMLEYLNCRDSFLFLQQYPALPNLAFELIDDILISPEIRLDNLERAGNIFFLAPMCKR